MKEVFVMSVYKFIETVGTSPNSWEEAARNALMTAAESLRDIRIAEVKELDMHIEGGNIVFRARISVSFRVEEIEERVYFKDPGSWLLEKEHSSMDG